MNQESVGRRAAIGYSLATLSVLCTGGLAGCTGTEPEHSHANDPWRNSDSEEGIRSESVSGTVVLPEGRYAIRTFDPTRSVELTLSVNVTSGGRIDVYTMEDAEFQRYREGEEFLLLQDYSVDDTDGVEYSGQIGAGSYVVVFDNTELFGASPDGEVRAEYEIVLSL